MISLRLLIIYYTGTLTSRFTTLSLRESKVDLFENFKDRAVYKLRAWQCFSLYFEK